MGPVICGVDESEGARGALQVARDLAARLELELVLLHVQPPTEAPGVSAAAGGQQRLREEELHEAESLLAELAGETGLSPEARRRTEIGQAAERILAVCEEERAALVVLGSRGRGGLKSALLGSVSSEVATKAPCPCVIVSPKASRGPALS